MVAPTEVCLACGAFQDSLGTDLRQHWRNCDIFGHMAANLRFSTAIEALALMATEPEKFHTVPCARKRAATNPVVIRRLLSVLSRASPGHKCEGSFGRHASGEKC